MGTVKAFKEYVLKTTSARDSSEFCFLSDAHKAFWEHLNDMGARNLRTHPPEIHPDIDRTVELTDEEWEELTRQFNEIIHAGN